MPRQRSLDDPWYTALYRDPHTLWWAYGLFYFPLLFVVLHFLASDSATHAALISAIFAVLCTLGILLRRKLVRR